MGYSFYLLSKDKPISEQDYETAIKKLSDFNRGEGSISNRPICDTTYSPKYISVSGSYTISGKFAEGFVLNLLMNLLDLGYTPKVLSRDWGYGSKEDWEWLESR